MTNQQKFIGDHYRRVAQERGTVAALNEAIVVLELAQTRIDELAASRFVGVFATGRGFVSVCKVTERTIPLWHDGSKFQKLYYVGDDGGFHPVTILSQRPSVKDLELHDGITEPARLIANGQTVGVAKMRYPNWAEWLS